MPLTGRKAHVARLKRLTGPAMERRVGLALFAAAEMIQVEAQISLTTGAVSGNNHVPSAPGDAPNQDTGYLGNSIEAALINPKLAEVSSNAEYSTALEFGTSKMAARPFMVPARDKCQPKIVELMKAAANKTVRGR